MKFCDVLNAYIEQLGCLAKDIEKHSGISASTLSRYRSGERIPDKNSENYKKLCKAIEEIASSKGIEYNDVAKKFSECFESADSPDCNVLRENFNMLITALDISIGKLCKNLSYDTSTIFRIRNGTRQPSDPTGFAKATAVYIAEITADNETALSALSGLINIPVTEFDSRDKITSTVFSWLISSHNDNKSSVADFLKKIDDFDLNLYIKTIRFDDIKIPTIPFSLPTSKYYYGISEMMQSELDFLKATVFSPSNEPVILYSDMPMEEMAKDELFPKKWMYGMACMLKKGLHLYQIHNLDRPFNEMMLGLESWIPMYMTGQITPYYLKDSQNAVFHHFLRVSGAAALSGEAISGHHSDGRYYLTKQKKELSYFRKRGEQLITRAEPLMDIYRSDKASNFRAQLISDSHIKGERRNILSTPPIYTLSDSLLSRILEHNNINGETAEAIKKFALSQRETFLHTLSHSRITDELPVIGEEEMNRYPNALSLSEMFCDTDVFYTYDELREHIIQTEHFAKTHDNYEVQTSNAATFRNLKISIINGKRVIISKGNSPAIHFIIRHEKLRAAIENFLRRSPKTIQNSIPEFFSFFLHPLPVTRSFH